MVETKGKKTHGTRISMSRAPLRLLSIVYILIHESVNRAENFTFRLPWPYGPKCMGSGCMCTGHRREKRLQNIINYTTFIACEFLYLHTSIVYVCVCKRCACGPRDFFSLLLLLLFCVLCSQFALLFSSIFLKFVLLLLYFWFTLFGLVSTRKIIRIILIMYHTAHTHTYAFFTQRVEFRHHRYI